MKTVRKTELNDNSRGAVSTSGRWHVPSLDEVRKAPNGNGREPVEALLSAGVRAEDLEAAMEFVVFVHLMPKAARFQDVRGFSGRSLALFPDELRRTARRIEMIRKNPFYAALLNLRVPGSKWEQTSDDLRSCADWLEAVIQGIRQNAEANPREYDLRLFSKRRLLATVAGATGNAHCDQVAALLNAAYDVAAPEAPLRMEEASALRHLWIQYKKTNTKRRYHRWAKKTI